MRSPITRAAIVLAAWLLFLYGLVPALVMLLVGDTLPVRHLELHPFLCALVGDALSDAFPSIVPFVDSLAEGDPIDGFRIRPAGWALMAAMHLPVAALVTWLGTITPGRRR